MPPNHAWRLNIFMVWQGLEILCTSVNIFSASEHLLASLCLQIRNMFSVFPIFLITFFYFPSGLCFWLSFSLCSNPNTHTNCSIFILRAVFMVICFHQLESACLVCSSLLSSPPSCWIPLSCSKFSRVHSVCCLITVIYITALQYRSLTEHMLKWFQESRT